MLTIPRSAPNRRFVAGGWNGTSLAIGGPVARDQLSDCLKKGMIVAYGISPEFAGSHEHRPIAPTAWDTIDTLTTSDRSLQPEDVGFSAERRPRYSEVFLIPNDVLAKWPPKPNSLATQKSCQRDLEEMMRARRDQPSPKGKIPQEMKLKYENLSERSFDLA